MLPRRWASCPSSSSWLPSPRYSGPASSIGAPRQSCQLESTQLRLQNRAWSECAAWWLAQARVAVARLPRLGAGVHGGGGGQARYRRRPRVVPGSTSLAHSRGAAVEPLGFGGSRISHTNVIYLGVKVDGCGFGLFRNAADDCVSKIPLLPHFCPGALRRGWQVLCRRALAVFRCSRQAALFRTTRLD